MNLLFCWVDYNISYYNALKMKQELFVFILRSFFITLINLGCPIRGAQTRYTIARFGFNQLFPTQCFQKSHILKTILWPFSEDRLQRRCLSVKFGQKNKTPFITEYLQAATSYRRLIDVENTSCFCWHYSVYWNKSKQGK